MIPNLFCTSALCSIYFWAISLCVLRQSILTFLPILTVFRYFHCSLLSLLWRCTTTEPLVTSSYRISMEQLRTPPKFSNTSLMTLRYTTQHSTVKHCTVLHSVPLMSDTYIGNFSSILIYLLCLSFCPEENWMSYSVLQYVSQTSKPNLIFIYRAHLTDRRAWGEPKRTKRANGISPHCKMCVTYLPTDRRK